MSQTLTAFPKRHRGRPPIHDWDTWSNEETHLLKQGVDFQSQVKSFQVLVHRTANRRGQKAHTKIIKQDNAIIIQFYTE